MSTDNVTPIRNGGGSSPGDPPAPTPETPKYLMLAYEEEDDAFTTLDLLNGLRGVCQAIDHAAVNRSCDDVENVGDLAMAAKALSDILARRWRV